MEYEKKKAKDPEILKNYSELPNISTELDKDHLDCIGKDVVDGYERDKQSLDSWYTQLDEIVDLTKLTNEPKDYPIKNSSNIKLPTILTAAMQYSARTFPELIRNGRVAQIKAFGKDPDGSKDRKAKRASRYIDYQLMVKDDNWERGTDRLLMLLPIFGTIFRKTYYDSSKSKIVSLELKPKECIIHSDVENLEEARRITHVMRMSKNSLVSKMRAGLYNEVDFDEVHNSQLQTYVGNDNKNAIDDNDKQMVGYTVLEQHTFLDLDNDDYDEPYIVTVLEETKQVLRIVARYTQDDIILNQKGKVECIYPEHYFTDYHFITNPDGSFYSVGFGYLLLAMTRACNTLTNQLIDAGHFANIQGGFIGRGLRQKLDTVAIPRGFFKQMEFADGEDIRKNIVPLDFKEPSPTLYKLLEFLLGQTKQISSITDIMSGDALPQNSPATTVTTLVEQSQKILNSINRRLYWSIKKELNKIFHLNFVFGDPEEYKLLFDDPEANLHEDFKSDNLDIRPISDPNLSSEVQRMAKVQYLSQIAASPLAQGRMNRNEIILRALEAADIQGVETLMTPDGQPSPEEQKGMAEMKLAEAQMKNLQDSISIESKKLELKAQELAHVLPIKEADYDYKIAQTRQAEGLAAQAVSEANIPKYRQFANVVGKQDNIGTGADANQAIPVNQPAGSGSMEAPPGNQAPQGIPPMGAG